MAKKKDTKLPLGHLQPYESIPDSQVWAIARLAGRGYGYKQIFSLPRGVTVSAVTESERDRFGHLARSQGWGVNNYRMLQTRDQVSEAASFIQRFPVDTRPPAATATLTSLVKQTRMPP